jgi:hypothetical protein
MGITSLILYVRTLAPGVLPGDSGEFQVLAYQLGIAHCPGYPVYLLMAKLVTFLPVGDIAYRVNLFSAIMAALAVCSVYLVARLISLNRWPAFATVWKKMGNSAAGGGISAGNLCGASRCDNTLAAGCQKWPGAVYWTR